MNVSEYTIRRDLQELASVSKLMKVHGGALSLAFSENPSKNDTIYSRTHKIRQVNADLCLLGTNAIDAKKGITDSDPDVVELKKAMIAASAKTV